MIKQWIDSETAYGSNLRYATTQYASMLESLKTKSKTSLSRQRRHNSESSSSQDSFCVGTNELQYIFGNIDDVAKCAERLASELDEIATTSAGEDRYHFAADRLADFIAVINMHMERESKAIRHYMENYLLYVLCILFNHVKIEFPHHIHILTREQACSDHVDKFKERSVVFECPGKTSTF